MFIKDNKIVKLLSSTYLDRKINTTVCNTFLILAHRY